MLRSSLAYVRGPERRHYKSRAALEGGYRQARLNEILPLCNTLNNLCICCKWAFSSQRGCALIPAWRGMGDPRVASPIIYKAQRRPALQHESGGLCGLPTVEVRQTSENT